MPFDELYQGLQAIADDQFPRRCATCGKVFRSLADYLFAETRALPGSSGLRAGEDDHGHSVVYLFRNCTCGSTLLDSFKERRDQSPAGRRRRRRFGELIQLLAGAGIDLAIARRELLKLLSGSRSEYLEQRGFRIRPRTA
jgi:hypothetical protein